LKPDRFDSVQSFRDFGKIVQRTAKKPIAGVVSATRIAPACDRKRKCASGGL
jgi:hypothetical protein